MVTADVNLQPSHLMAVIEFFLLTMTHGGDWGLVNVLLCRLYLDILWDRFKSNLAFEMCVPSV